MPPLNQAADAVLEQSNVSLSNVSLIAPSIVKEYGERALRRCQVLSELSELPDGILRQYLTPEHKACNQQVAKWMQAAGMSTWQDQVGNQWGRLASKNPEAKRLIIGSHLDTVPYAGAFDGILGVLLAIEVAELAKREQLELPFHLDIVGFCDEEGTRFATTLIGSKALAGQFDADWLNLTDSNGITMAQALRDFGLAPELAARQAAALSSDELLGYWEVHIEQGPVLEAQQQPLGVVSAIAGAKRAMVEFIGQSGHAGTTPMNLRQDSLTAAAELVLAVENSANHCQCDEVATVGVMQAKPGATNVIPGGTEMSLDIRAQDDDQLQQLVNSIYQQGHDIAKKRQLKINWQWTHAAPAVQCDANIIELFTNACQQVSESAPILPSGAGHDAMAIAEICPVGMLFIRSPGGISHHPDESVIDTDVVQALEVLYVALCQQAQHLSA